MTDLTGDHAERWRLWDSCFALDFGSSGCVGCGRCIAWCPTGIDITREVSALASLQDLAAPDEDKP